MRVGYARVSTDEQAEALTAQVQRLNDAGCSKVLQERESGTVDDRPALAELMALVKLGKVDELLITRVDRLGRHAAFTDQLVALCDLKNTTIRALDGGVVESATPQGFLMARLVSTMAEVESRMLSQRIRKQFDAYKTQGRHLRRRDVFGYRKRDKFTLEPNPEQWPIALRVIELLQETGSFTKTANRLPQFSDWTPAPGNLQEWFLNPVIRGHIAHGKERSTITTASGQIKQGPCLKGWDVKWAEINYDQHPALITEEDWRDLSIRLRQTKNRFNKGDTTGQPKHGLTGLLKCASCGHTMRRNQSGGVYWWRCRHRLCTAKGGIKEPAALDAVVGASTQAAQAFVDLLSQPTPTNPAVAAKKQDLDQMRQLAARNPVLTASVEALQREIEELENRPAPTINREALETILSWIETPEFFSDKPPELLRPLFNHVLQEVRIGPGGKDIQVIRRST